MWGARGNARQALVARASVSAGRVARQKLSQARIHERRQATAAREKQKLGLGGQRTTTWWILEDRPLQAAGMRDILYRSRGARHFAALSQEAKDGVDEAANTSDLFLRELHDIVKDVQDLADSMAIHKRIRDLESKALPALPYFDANSVSRSFHAYGRIRTRPGKDMFDALYRQMREERSNFTAIDASNTMWALNSMGEEIARDDFEMFQGQIIEGLKEMRGQDIASVLTICVKQNIQPSRSRTWPNFFEKLEAQAEAEIKRFEPHHIAALLLAYANLHRRPGQELMDGIEECIARLIKKFRTQDIAILMRAYAKHGVPPSPEVLAAIEGQAMAGISSFRPWEITTLLWACGELKVKLGAASVAELDAHAVNEIRFFSFEDCLHLLRAFATYSARSAKVSPSDALVRGLEKVVTEKVHEIDFALAYDLMHEYTKLRIKPGEGFVGMLEDHAMESLGQHGVKITSVSSIFKTYAGLRIQPGWRAMAELEAIVLKSLKREPPGNILDLLQSYTYLGLAVKTEIMNAVEEQILRRRSEFNHRHIPGILWYFQKLGVRPGPQLMDCLERQAYFWMRSFDAPSIAGMLRSFAAFGWTPKRPLISAFGEQIKGRVDRCRPRDVSAIMYGFARVEIQPSKDVADALMGRALSQIERYDPADVSSTLRALSMLGLEPRPDLLSGLLGHCTRSIGTFSPGNASTSFRALASLGIHPGNDFITVIEERAKSEMERFLINHVGNMLIAYTLLKIPPNATLLLSMAEQVEASLKHGWVEYGRVLNSQEISHIHLFLLASELEGWGELEQEGSLAAREKLRNVIGGGQQGQILAEADRMSGNQRQLQLLEDVAARLVRMFEHSFEQGVVDERSGYTIDVLGRPAEGDARCPMGIAVEIGGASYFCAGGQRPTGETRLKRRILTAMGYRVVGVPYWIWDDLQEAEKDSFLREMLKM